MTVGSMEVVAGAVSRHINWRLLTRPPVICFVWTALTSVVAHSVGKKAETSRRAEGVSRRIGVRASVSSAAMFVGGTVCFSRSEKNWNPTLHQVIILILLFSKSHAAGK